MCVTGWKISLRGGFTRKGKTAMQGRQSHNLKSTERIKVLKFKFLNLIVLPCPLFYVTYFIKKLKSLAS